MEGRLCVVLLTVGFCFGAPVHGATSFRPKLEQPALNPLVVSCMANTPILLHRCVMVWPYANKPTTSIDCRITGLRSLNCSNSAVMFTGVPAGVHRLVITARTASEEASVTYKLVVPAESDVCTTHLINSGVTVDNHSAVVEFSGYGPYTGFMCKVDSPTTFPCRSPLTLTDLTEGEHWLRVIPVGCREEERQTFFFTVPPSASATTQSFPSSGDSSSPSSPLRD